MTAYLEQGIGVCHLFDSTPSATLAASVIVPMKNEETYIYATLDALRNQMDIGGQPIDHRMYEVLLLANNCTDNTFGMAMAYKDFHPEFNLHVAQLELQGDSAHIGTVRRILMDEASRRVEMVKKTDGIIISTDGDTVVDRHWLYHILKEFEGGCDVVGGRIIPEKIERSSLGFHLRDVAYRMLCTRLESIIDPCPYDPWPRHFQCFGPSIAVKSHIYKKAGRLPPLPYLEDEHFRRALLHIDARIRRSPHVKVYTSAREQGRVDFGFSVQLRQWSGLYKTSYVQQVEPLDALLAKYKAKKKLKQLLQRYKAEKSICRQCLRQLAIDLVLDELWLEEQIGNARYFGTMWDEIEQKNKQGAWKRKYPDVAIESAIQQLRLVFNSAK